MTFFTTDMECKCLSVPALCLGMFTFWLALVLRSPSFNFITRDVPLRTQIEVTTFQDRRVVANSCLCQKFPHVATAATLIQGCDILMPAKGGQEEGAQTCRQAGEKLKVHPHDKDKHVRADDTCGEAAEDTQEKQPQ